MRPPMSETEELLARIAVGDVAARDALFARHRDKLLRMVAVRLDRRLLARVDPSDVIQETMLEAMQRLPEFLFRRPIPYYVWIRQLALDHVIRQHRRHIGAGVRTLNREEQHAAPLPDHSAIALAMKLVAGEGTPDENVERAELLARVHQVLSELKPEDRELLALRYLEQLSAAETADILGVTLAAVKSRQRRALERFCQLFDSSGEQS